MLRLVVEFSDTERCVVERASVFREFANIWRWWDQISTLRFLRNICRCEETIGGRPSPNLLKSWKFRSRQLSHPWRRRWQKTCSTKAERYTPSIFACQNSVAAADELAFTQAMALMSRVVNSAILNRSWAVWTRNNWSASPKSLRSIPSDRKNMWIMRHYCSRLLC